MMQTVKAKFHYASWFEAGRRPASNQLRTSFVPASVMEFGFDEVGLYKVQPTNTLRDQHEFHIQNTLTEKLGH